MSAPRRLCPKAREGTGSGLLLPQVDLGSVVGRAVRFLRIPGEPREECHHARGRQAWAARLVDPGMPSLWGM